MNLSLPKSSPTEISFHIYELRLDTIMKKLTPFLTYLIIIKIKILQVLLTKRRIRPEQHERLHGIKKRKVRMVNKCTFKNKIYREQERI